MREFHETLVYRNPFSRGRDFVHGSGLKKGLLPCVTNVISTLAIKDL